jgi:NAD(P)-dependent dehydrogenase (short-subunit alcohol dehydrogenase family)
MNEILKSFDLSAKVAAITGAGGGLCGAMAEALGQMGVSVAVLDIAADKAEARAQSLRNAGGTAAAVPCDVLDTSQIKRAYDTVCGLWGPPDFLVNGAGGNDARGSTGQEFQEPGPLPERTEHSFFDLDPAGFSQVFNLNFFSTFLVTQVFSRGMVSKRAGSIVNISSMSAFRPLTKVGPYSAAKASVSNFTQWLAVHLAKTGVRVNALAPGFFLTEQLRFLHFDPKTGEPTPRAKKVIEHTPLGRYGAPEDLVGTLVWLLSDASRFVTGAVIPVDGGFSCYSI